MPFPFIYNTSVLSVPFSFVVSYLSSSSSYVFYPFVISPILFSSKSSFSLFQFSTSITLFYPSCSPFNNLFNGSTNVDCFIMFHYVTGKNNGGDKYFKHSKSRPFACQAIALPLNYYFCTKISNYKIPVISF